MSNDDQLTYLNKNNEMNFLKTDNTKQEPKNIHDTLFTISSKSTVNFDLYLEIDF